MLRTPLTEQERIARVVRLLQLMIGLLLSAVVILSVLLFIVVVKKKQDIRFVELSSEGRYRILESDMTKEQRAVHIEQALESYIKLRLEMEGTKNTNGFLNQIKMAEVISQSSDKVSVEYQKELQRLFEEGHWDQRRVKITSYNLESPPQNLYRYDIIISDYFNDEENVEIVSKRYVLYVSYEQLDINSFTLEELRANPMGIKITYFKNQYNE